MSHKDVPGGDLQGISDFRREIGGDLVSCDDVIFVQYPQHIPAHPHQPRLLATSDPPDPPDIPPPAHCRARFLLGDLGGDLLSHPLHIPTFLFAVETLKIEEVLWKWVDAKIFLHLATCKTKEVRHFELL